MYKVLEWNINQRANSSYELPLVICQGIQNIAPDIVVLTEFRFGKNSIQFLKELFEDKGYNYYPRSKTENTSNNQNELLIAWKESVFTDLSEKEHSICKKNEDKVPNFTMVKLESISERKKVYIAGIRIKTTKPYCTRNDQMEYVYKKIEDKDKSNEAVLIAGDFNNFRRNTGNKDWNINKIVENKPLYTRYTPSGGSWDGKGSDEYPLDHFVTRNCEIIGEQYSRDFINYDKEYYSSSRFSCVEPPYPDHSMLIGTLKL